MALSNCIGMNVLSNSFEECQVLHEFNTVDTLVGTLIKHFDFSNELGKAYYFNILIQPLLYNNSHI